MKYRLAYRFICTACHYQDCLCWSFSAGPAEIFFKGEGELVWHVNNSLPFVFHLQFNGLISGVLWVWSLLTVLFESFT